MDLQPDFNYYKAVSCMSAYFSKSESQAQLQACSKVTLTNLNAREAMHKLASSYSSLRMVSLQEGLYYNLSELSLRKFSKNSLC